MSEETPTKSIRMIYKNWRGETSERHIIPARLWFGRTEHHPELQYLLDALDLDKRAERTFALAECQFIPRPTTPKGHTNER